MTLHTAEFDPVEREEFHSYKTSEKADLSLFMITAPNMAAVNGLALMAHYMQRTAAHCNVLVQLPEPDTAA